MGGCQTDPRRFLHVVAFPSGGTLFPVVAGLWPAVACTSPGSTLSDGFVPGLGLHLDLPTLEKCVTQILLRFGWGAIPFWRSPFIDFVDFAVFLTILARSVPK